MPFEIDLNTRIIAKDREIYVARPGRGYRLYRDIVDAQTVVVDLPFLDLKNGVPLAKIKDLDARIKRSRALRSWYRRKREGDTPSRDLSDYAKQKTGASVHQLRAIVSGYFEKLKKGDLVIIPPSAYSQLAMIGEVTGDADDYLRITAPRVYGKEPLTGRQVTWLAGIEKRRLPTSILDPLEKPTALFLLARLLRPTIYMRLRLGLLLICRRTTQILSLDLMLRTKITQPLPTFFFRHFSMRSHRTREPLTVAKALRVCRLPPLMILASTRRSFEQTSIRQDF